MGADIRSVAVVGGGTMGGGIAGHLARAGLAVALVDASPELAERAHDRLLERTRGHVGAGLLGERDLSLTERVTVAADLEAAAAGRLGAKGGEGFTAYSDDERATRLLDRDRRYAALANMLEERA
jgi:3-hydroxyacyl-CoA dehydrogenase